MVVIGGTKSSLEHLGGDRINSLPGRRLKKSFFVWGKRPTVPTSSKVLTTCRCICIRLVAIVTGLQWLGNSIVIRWVWILGKEKAIQPELFRHGFRVVMWFSPISIVPTPFPLFLLHILTILLKLIWISSGINRCLVAEIFFVMQRWSNVAAAFVWDYSQVSRSQRIIVPPASEHPIYLYYWLHFYSSSKEERISLFSTSHYSSMFISNGWEFRWTAKLL
jgi:hypothetical protein